MQYTVPASAASNSATVGDLRNQMVQFDSARTNLILQSQAFSTAPWALGGGVTVPTTNGTDPRGGATACTISDAAGTLGELTQPITVANDGTQYVVSCYFTAGTSLQSKFGVRLSGGTPVDQFVEFVPQSGLVITSAGTYTINAFTIGGVSWYRVNILIANNTSGNVTLTPYIQPASANVGATGTILAFGAQVETAPTNGAAVPSAYVQTASVAETTPAGTLPAFLQGKAVDIQTFLANGNSTAPAWANRALLIGVGGGGGGGGSPSASPGYGAGGGGGGQRTEGTIVTVVPGAITAVTIGNGGNGGGNNTNGSSGSATTFGALLTLAGGSGGAKSVQASGFANGGTGGVPGQNDGFNGTYMDVAFTISAAGGNGGGNGGQGGINGGVGSNAAANSGGGGGGHSGSGVLSGGNGGSGKLVVIYYRA